jgi:hypothetical protein
LLEKVTTNWPQLRERVGHIDKNLPAFLASCKPLATEGEVLILGFDYPILKEKFDKRQKAAGTIADVLGEMLQTKINVRAVVTDQYSPPKPVSKIDVEEFAALAKELGGIVKES